MSKDPAIPEPLYSFLTIDCNAESYLLDETAEVLRTNPDSDYSLSLFGQLKDPTLLEKLSDPKVLERMTGYGFESVRDTRAWLNAVRRYVFENGPPPGIEDFD